MQHVVIKHRHLGLSIIVMTQTFHGLPRAIRLNCTLYVLFRTSDLKQLNQIYEHFGGMVPKEEFMAMYDHATEAPHGFLMIDADPKNPAQRFRNGFNEFMSIEK